MKLSIIIPVYNSSKLLDYCLEKFNTIDERSYEIIIIDSESDDNIKSVIKKHINLPLIYHREADDGIYDAFNKGVKLSSGSFLFFMGSDDLINPEIFNAIDCFPAEADILVGSITSNGQIECWQPGFLGWNLLIRNIPHQAMIFRRQIFDSDLYVLKYRVLSDYAWNIVHFWDKNTKYYFINKILCEWSPGGVSQTHRDFAFEEDKFNLVRFNTPFLLFTFYFFYKFFFKKVFR